jgi:hypothetical protein
MRYAIVEGGIVSNVVLADAPVESNWVETEEAGIGWLYDGSLFTSPAEPEPVPPTQAEQEAKRQAAYVREADPTFFKWQAGEATEQEWLAKRQEIRDRYPYPV